MAGMMKSATGKEMSEEQIAQVQSMMSNMSEEDMMKWSGRMQRLAGWAQKPVAAYRAAAAAVDRVPGGLLTVLCAVSGVLLVGHLRPEERRHLHVVHPRAAAAAPRRQRRAKALVVLTVPRQINCLV